MPTSTKAAAGYEIIWLLISLCYTLLKPVQKIPSLKKLIHPAGRNVWAIIFLDESFPNKHYKWSRLLPLHNSSHPKIQTMQTVKTEYFFLNTWLTFLVLRNYVQYVLMFVVYPQAAYTRTSFCWFNWHPGLKDFVWKIPLTTGPKYTKIKHKYKLPYILDTRNCGLRFISFVQFVVSLCFFFQLSKYP